MSSCLNYHRKKYNHSAEGNSLYAGGGRDAPEKIALLLRMEAETVQEIMAAKQAHIEKCGKKLEQAVNQ